ncbi:MAG: cyclic nucleotide-binding domain-containing protein [Nitrospinaceae bacterium]
MSGLAKRIYPKGRYIVRQGTHGTSAFIIERGEVEVFQMDSYGNKRVLAILKEQDVFGEIALMSNCLRTANVRALEDCKVAVLTRATFQKIPANHPVRKKFRKLMAERLDELRSVPVG